MLNQMSLLLVAASALVLGACARNGDTNRGRIGSAMIAADETIDLAGTEPFWSLNIAPSGDGYVARYAAPDVPDGKSFPVTRSVGSGGVEFAGTMDGERVQIAITPGECSDGMSDVMYLFVAKVALGESTLVGCGKIEDSSPTEL